MTRIRPIRSKPRRGRVRDQDYREWILEQVCLLDNRSDTACRGIVTGHHVKSGPGHLKDDLRLVPLCQAHHLHDFGPDSIERLGREQWERRFDVSLERQINRLQGEFCGTEINA